jgi:hypothetical protein
VGVATHPHATRAQEWAVIEHWLTKSQESLLGHPAMSVCLTGFHAVRERTDLCDCVDKSANCICQEETNTMVWIDESKCCSWLWQHV